MKISLNEIKKLVPAARQVETADLVRLIGSRLVEVEEAIDLSPKYQNAFIVRVLECEPIPDTHLSLCQLDAGEGENVQVVCGAPNVRKGMLAVWLAPGAIVPQTYGGEDFKLGVRKMRGYDSHGMLAGLDELDLGDAHSGIVEIDPSMDFPGTTRNVQPGDSFAEAFELNDTILDIENKSLTHRPDTFGLVGFAREVAGILGAQFDANDIPDTFKSLHDDAVQVAIEDAALCPRYTAAIVNLKDPTAKSKYLTPAAVFLAKAGMRTIDHIVDVTNILMLKTGQPLHAFDYDKFLKVGGASKAKIVVRAAKDGEELQLLDGKTIKCIPSDILITSNNVPVALAGAMGGASTEIDSSTTRVLLESATFSLYHLRKTQRHHGIFSEAITRFTKGQPAGQTSRVLAEAINALGGELEAAVDAYPAKAPATVVKITTSDINGLLGTDYTSSTIVNTLENVGFTIEKADKEDVFNVKVPYWRTDIHIKEDLIEEVGRLNGFDNIPKTLPLRPFIGAKNDPMLSLKHSIRNILSDNLGAHEVLSYSFVSQKLQQNVGEDPSDSYQITNSISPELQCVRQSLIPSLLEKAQLNLKAGYKDFALYEMNQVSKKSYGLNSEKVPVMRHHLAFVTTGDFYAAKFYLETLLRHLGFSDVSIKQFKPGAKYFEPLHSASVQLSSLKKTDADKTDVEPISLGEIRSLVLKNFKIDQPIAAFELDLDLLAAGASHASSRAPQISRYPSVDRDLTLGVDNSVAYATLEAAIKSALSARQDFIWTLRPASIYQKSATSKNISFSLTFAHTKKTLDSDEISAIMEEVIKSVQSVGATVI